jgi:Mg-chelatase subunit ChlD
MNQNIQQLDDRSFQNVARAIASKANVSVAFGADKPQTYREVITMPSIHSHKDQDVLLGFLVHECGRVRDTDFSVSTDKFTNIFESHRTERFMQSILGGGEELMLKAWKHVFENQTSASAEESTAFSSVDNYLQMKGQEITMKRSTLSKLVANELDKTKDAVEKHWGNITTMLDAFLTRSKYTNSTQDAHQISEEIHKHLMALKPDDENEEEDSEQNENNDANEQSQQEEASPASDQSGSDDSLAGIDRDTLQKSKDSLTEEFDKGEVSKGLSDQIDGMMQTIIQESIKESGHAPVLPGIGCRQGPLTKTTDSIVQNNAEKISEGITHAIKLLVETQTRNRIQAKRKGKRPITSKLAKVAAGETRIFESRLQKTTIDTAVTIAVDMSGSMKNCDRGKVALAASIGLTRALNITRGASSRMTVFPGYAYTVEQVTPRGSLPDISISGLQPHGGTPLLEAVEDATLELQQQRSKKKVAIIITDGDIYSKTAHDSLRIAKGRNVSLLWIAIGTDNFPIKENVIKINEPQDLPSALLAHARGLF